MRCVILYISLFFFTAASAQESRIPDSILATKPVSNSQFGFHFFIPGDYISMNVDAIGNIYLLTKNYQLKKCAANGDSLAVFNDVKRFGNPSYIDVSNPFKTLVYYRNYSTIVVLDRMLTVRNIINLRKNNIFKVKAVTSSYDNNIWLFDEQDFKLKKINDNGETILESNDLRQLTDTVPSPLFISESENFVYLYDPARGFTVFDQYGYLKNTIPFKNWNNISIVNGWMFGFADNTLFSYESKSLKFKEYTLGEFLLPFESIVALNGKVYRLTADGVQIYNLL